MVCLQAKRTMDLDALDAQSDSLTFHKIERARSLGHTGMELTKRAYVSTARGHLERVGGEGKGVALVWCGRKGGLHSQ